ncbi:amidase [Rhizobium sp. NPDC090275]|uniref:amidase n=1 Tax=Rhizobium sp. NPDC090275 TaxID=3364498 RepID=UPI00383B5371
MQISADQPNDVCWRTAKELTCAFSRGEISPVEVAEATLTRAEEVHADFNAFTAIDRDGALLAAKASAKRWKSGAPLSPIDGVPTTIKDIVQFHGGDIRYGSLVTGDISDLDDAPSVGRLRQAGAVFLGFTTTPEFGWKAVTDNRKDGVTLNPWDRTKTPGGSSGGAAVAAATGAGVLHLGTDGGGSIRIPASFTGIVGHKPSFGRVAAYPASAFGTVAHIGPMARTVEDVALMLDVMSGRDLRDWTQTHQEFQPLSLKAVNWRGKKIGYWKQPCVGSVQQSVSDAVETVLRDLELAGAAVTEIKLPEQDDLLEIFYRHWYVGAANRLSAVDERLHDRIDPGFIDAVKCGQRYTAVERMQAETHRARYGAQMDALLDSYDYLISPTVAIAPFEAGRNFPRDGAFASWVEWASFSFPINLSQQPACSVPCGLNEEGLPIGLQIIGARGDDAGVLDAALTYQQMYPDHFLTSGRKAPFPGQGKS